MPVFDGLIRAFTPVFDGLIRAFMPVFDGLWGCPYAGSFAPFAGARMA
jgi:hypothetical protein